MGCPVILRQPLGHLLLRGHSAPQTFCFPSPKARSWQTLSNLDQSNKWTSKLINNNSFTKSGEPSPKSEILFTLSVQIRRHWALQVLLQPVQYYGKTRRDLNQGPSRPPHINRRKQHPGLPDKRPVSCWSASHRTLIRIRNMPFWRWISQIFFHLHRCVSIGLFALQHLMNWAGI